MGAKYKSRHHLVLRSENNPKVAPPRPLIEVHQLKKKQKSYKPPRACVCKGEWKRVSIFFSRTTNGPIMCTGTESTQVFVHGGDVPAETSVVLYKVNTTNRTSLYDTTPNFATFFSARRHISPPPNACTIKRWGGTYRKERTRARFVSHNFKYVLCL